MTDDSKIADTTELERQFNIKIESHLRHYYSNCLGLYDWQRRIEFRKNEIQRAEAWIRAIEDISGIKLKGKKILDVGCGWGGYLVAGAKLGAECTGCDVDNEVLDIAQLRIKLAGIRAEVVRAAAEKLPFADDEFDFVQAVSVLEHVDDVAAAVKEMLRVLKPHGVGFVQSPNYFIPVEPHYKILFPPKCPKKLAKIYLKLLARPVQFIDTINYVDYGMIRKLLESNGALVTDVLGEFKRIVKTYYHSLDESQITGIKPPLSSYNAFAGKLMTHSFTMAGNFFQNILGVKNIFFMFRK